MPEQNVPDQLILPAFIRSRAQVHKLITEVLGIENFLYKSRVRESGSKMNLPSTTSELDRFAEANKRNVLHHNQRMELANFLRKVYKKAPEVIMYAPRHDAQIAEGVTQWFRSNIHAQTLIDVRQDSRISAGCVLRIKHKTYDLTLNDRLRQANARLAQDLAITRSQ